MQLLLLIFPNFEVQVSVIINQVNMLFSLFNGKHTTNPDQDQMKVFNSLISFCLFVFSDFEGEVFLECPRNSQYGFQHEQE